MLNLLVRLLASKFRAKCDLLLREHHCTSVSTYVLISVSTGYVLSEFYLNAPYLGDYFLIIEPKNNVCPDNRELVNLSKELIQLYTADIC